MRSLLKFTILAVFCGLFLMQTVATAQKTSDEMASDSKKEAGIIFPAIEGWEKGDIVTYPTAELGYSIPYRSEDGGTVTIYVYNGGNKEISSDLNDKIIKNEMKRSENEIKKFGELGYYDDVKHMKADTIKLGGTTGKVESLRSLFHFAIRGNDVTSEIYLFSYDNNFIKIRSTRLREEEGEKNEAFVKLLAELDTLFSK